MSLSPSTLSAIQHAGQGLHAARQAVSEAVQANVQQLVGMVASQPFSPESDRAYAQLRAVSRLAHELQAMEDQLKTLYLSAAEMMAPETPVLVALPGLGGRSRARYAAESHEEAEDATVKPAPKRQPRKAKARQEAAKQPQRLSRNDEKVLQYLKQVLDRRSWKPLTQAAIAQGAGIPPGSAGLALRRALAAGALREGTKGNYRLGQSGHFPATDKARNK